MIEKAKNAGLTPMNPSCVVRVSVVIKALNEEKNIAAAVSSALAAVAELGGEVILADSISTDRTVEIARQYPITVVQLKNASERRCGIGPQLGYQKALGEFVYILDGDMELSASFLTAALKEMDSDSLLAGVAGLVEEESESNYQFRGRKRRRAEGIAGDCEWLDMGGLYRAKALRDVGYFSNRNLHAYEEMELGLRLSDAGWKLRRIAVRSVQHRGRTEAGWELLKRRWKSRYLDGSGELLRAALRKPYFWRAAFMLRHLFAGLLVWLGLIGGVAMLAEDPWLLVSTVIFTVVLVLVRAWRIGSFADACFGQIVWQVTSLAMVRGFLAKPVDPKLPVEFVTVP